MKKHAEQSPGDSVEQPMTSAEHDAGRDDAPENMSRNETDEKQELIEHLQRMQAEFDNYRKRVERDQVEMKNAASERILRDLLPIIDNLQLSVQHAKGNGDTTENKDAIQGEDLIAGIVMINEQLKTLLEHYGITEIPDGGRFDPHRHEALMMVNQEGVERGTVLQTYQRGYLRGDKIFRPAKVSVAK